MLLPCYLLFSPINIYKRKKEKYLLSIVKYIHTLSFNIFFSVYDKIKKTGNKVTMLIINDLSK